MPRAGRMGLRGDMAMDRRHPGTTCRTGRTWEGGNPVVLNIPLVLRAVLEDHALPWDSRSLADKPAEDESRLISPIPPCERLTEPV